jgi:hypothetical protein
VVNDGDSEVVNDRDSEVVMLLAATVNTLL